MNYLIVLPILKSFKLLSVYKYRQITNTSFRTVLLTTIFMQNFRIPEDKKPVVEEFKTYMASKGRRLMECLSDRGGMYPFRPGYLPILVYLKI